MSSSSVVGGLVGARVKRKEDVRILTGQGRYIDDVQERGTLTCYFVRSAFPHARIASIDVEQARAVEGVTAVITGAEMAGYTNPINLGAPIPGLNSPTYPVLAIDKVCYVGEPVVLVVAQDRYVAEDAAGLVEIDYEPLDPVVTTTAALAEGAPQLYDDVPGNLIYAGGFSVGDVDAAFAQADHVVTDRLDQHRWSCVPMEGRGGVATFDRSTGVLTYEASTQTTHLLRLIVAGFINQPLHLMRVVANDIGGAFGEKFSPYREDIALCAAAKRLGASLKWVEDRSENLAAAGGARDESLELEAAVKADGTLLGLRVKMAMNQGAGSVMPPSPVVAKIAGYMLPGPYRWSAYSFAATVACTNKAPYISLRGPWAVETLVRERLLDLIARRVGLSPVEVRKRNLIPLSQQPAAMGSGVTMDGVTAAETFERLTSRIDLTAIRAEQEKARAEGRLLGFGVATMFEPAPGTAGFWEKVGFPFDSEPARIRIEPDGHVTAFTSQVPHGQGHETTLAQVIADEMGVAFDDVRVVFGDTDATKFTMIGTAGSKAGMMATGGVTVAARELRSRVLNIAAHMLEVSAGDLQIADSVISVKGDPGAAIPLADIAMGCYMAPAEMPAGVDVNLEVTEVYDGEGGGWGQASHACWVEIDQETGKISIERFLVAEDCGKIINPGIVEGQVIGGVAMGLGGMLLEHSAYDEDGQYLAATFMDYLMPSAPEVPEIEIEHLEVESDTLIGSRGVGEGGTVLAPAALLNAIDDALSQVGGTRITATPVTPTRVLEALGVIEGTVNR
jgi:aerobic carbon-monoxide dehydrogenase large subunit